MSLFFLCVRVRVCVRATSCQVAQYITVLSICWSFWRHSPYSASIPMFHLGSPARLARQENKSVVECTLGGDGYRALMAMQQG